MSEWSLGAKALFAIVVMGSVILLYIASEIIIDWEVARAREKKDKGNGR